MTGEANHKIAISGDLGSGKSTVCRLLKERLSFGGYSMGETWRRLAEKYQMTILELNRYSETHPLDEEMDRDLTETGQAPGNMIFDSRLAWHFVPDSFKVHLVVDSRIAASRIYNDLRGQAEGYASVEQAHALLQERKASENRRYLQKYGVDCTRLQNYDLVVDTSMASPERIAELICTCFEAWRNGKTFTPLWLSPQSLFPARESDGSGCDRSEVALLEVDCFLYIWEGLETVSHALREGSPWVAARVIARDEEFPATRNDSARKLVQKHCRLELLQDWEAQHQFRFSKYPSIF